MATGADVLRFLIPTGGWAISGNDWEGVEFLEAEPITEQEFLDGFAQYDVWKAEQDATKATQRQALLTRLGITEDEARLLLG